MRGAERQSGFVTIEFLLGCAFILLPVFMLVVTFPTWAERQEIATNAAREGARAAVETSDPVSADREARAVIAEVAYNSGLEPAEVAEILASVRVSGNPGNRNDTVGVFVEVPVPFMTVPFWPSSSTPAFHYSATAQEKVDRYRSL